MLNSGNECMLFSSDLAISAFWQGCPKTYIDNLATSIYESFCKKPVYKIPSVTKIVYVYNRALIDNSEKSNLYK